MGTLDKRLNLPFDRHQPYDAISGVLERLREGSGPLDILDVSGGESALPSFLPEDRVSVLEGPKGSLVPGSQDAGVLPFEDGAFDYVVGVDVYGRVEPGARDRYLSGLRRVSGKGVLLSGPFDSAVVRDAERITDEVRRSLGAEKERQTGHGLPALDGMKRSFEEHGDTVFVLPNGYVPHWLAMTSLSLYGAAREDDLGGLFQRVNAFYNEYVCGLDDVEPSYRHLLVSLKGTVDADLDGLLGGAPEAGRAARDLDLSGALFAMLPLTAEVERLKVRLAVKEGELARKEVQVDDLFGRLAGLVSAENTHRVHHNNLQRINRALTVQRDGLQRQIDRITGSRSWRLLTLLRRIKLRITGSG